MSNQQLLTGGIGPPATSNIEFLEGNDGLPVGPDATTHILMLLGDATKGVSVVKTATHTETISVDFATTSSVGVSYYNPDDFTVDPDGEVSLIGSVPLEFETDNGSDTAIPSGGIIKFEGLAAKNLGQPLMTDAPGSASTVSTTIQIASAQASASVANAGVASFDSTDFNVDADTGFVQLVNEPISTITGDSGTISGTSLTIYADNTDTNCGSSVSFVNSGTTSTLNLTDSGFNTLLGNNAGNLSITGFNNTGTGYFSLHALTSGNFNTTVDGLVNLESGIGNSAFGYSTLNNLITGNYNTALGYGYSLGVTPSGSNYTTSESSNVCIANAGITGESNVMRLGTQGSGDGQVNKTFIAGIIGVTVANQKIVTVNSSTGQLGDISNNFITSVTTSNATPQFALTGSTENIDFNLSNLCLGTSFPALTSGTLNCGFGQHVGQHLTSAQASSGFGYSALSQLTTGVDNSGFGYDALASVTTGTDNTAVGAGSLGTIDGSFNTAVGSGAGTLSTHSSNNTCVGYYALNSVTGSNNIAIGYQAGVNTTSGSSNIYIGNTAPVLAESNIIRIGTQGSSAGQQNKFFAAGITGTTPTGGNAPQVVLCDNVGQLTPISSSTSGFVLTSNGTGTTPSFQAAGGGGGSATAFFAYCASNVNNVLGGAAPGPYTIICPTTSRNDGTNYSTSTGLFTAPSTGFYCFCATIYLNSGGGFTAGSEILVSSLGSVSSNVHYQKLTIDATNSLTNTALPFTWMINMTAGDTMGIAAYCNSAVQDVSIIGNAISNSFFTAYTSFSGFLVGA